MTPETYLVGSVYLSLIVFAMLSDPIDEFQKCPKCEAKMQDVRGSEECMGTQGRVMLPILKRTCPKCGYEERSWG